ncbi:hypothetical protein HBH98_096760 [Parastagonospora nodorum]|nr:hypothetical protein HBH52_123550 [Parastagonospora nodorum]KAH3978551.1 hypothetical protein HBH51_060490 [Parastagonospora nodorum]KAH4049068.1 hypothetical protein HBH49_141940 [Parastagonospora nodorum]KAH4122555.1 hypothetical protein HBH47_079690 [Parastagonospora nodorum]KAH4285090.1 hypothetical protein HBI02_236190 [Parastagonospora nodorum]
MIIPSALVFLLSGIHSTGAVSIRQTSNGVATVNLAETYGPAKSLASGWIYGFPDNGTDADFSIPEHFVRDVKFHSTRAGGAQIPAKGWVTSLEDYIGRFNSTLSNYRTTRHYGGDFILLIHDLWGADGGSISTFPGDNGNWSLADAFFQRLKNDLVENDMLDGLVLDLWNEPDISNFWARSWPQYLEYWVRSYNFFRKEMAGTLISGPSMAASPKPDNTNWTAWLAKAAETQTVPDIYAWHQIGTWSRQGKKFRPDETVPDFKAMKAVHSLPDLPIDVNEYADRPEQNPANSVYYIAQHERHSLRALRANWGSGSDLHDYLANLLYKDNDGYYPNGEWHLYKYYAQMEGDRITTTASADRRFDVFAVKSASTVKIIAGTRTINAPYEIRISGMQSLGLPEQGSISANVVRFDWAGDQGRIEGPVALGQTSFSYSGDTLTILVDQPNNATAFAYEFEI